MIIRGTAKACGSMWTASIPVLDAMTQGRDRHDAIHMSVAWIRDILDITEMPITYRISRNGRHALFDLVITDPDVMRLIIPLILRRLRAKHGFSLADMARSLGARSRNAYARYEQGHSMPTIVQFDRLMRSLHHDYEVTII
jgi:DNA-binding XRE family transcriptional regulator